MCLFFSLCAFCAVFHRIMQPPLYSAFYLQYRGRGLGIIFGFFFSFSSFPLNCSFILHICVHDHLFAFTSHTLQQCSSMSVSFFYEELKKSSNQQTSFLLIICMNGVRQQIRTQRLLSCGSVAQLFD